MMDNWVITIVVKLPVLRGDPSFADIKERFGKPSQLSCSYKWGVAACKYICTVSLPQAPDRYPTSSIIHGGVSQESEMINKNNHLGADPQMATIHAYLIGID